MSALLSSVTNTKFNSALGVQTHSGSAREPLIDPASGVIWGEVTHGPELVTTAVDTAVAAFSAGEWRALPAMARADALDAVGRGVQDHLEEIAALESLSNGKPLSATRAEVAVSARWWQYYAALLRTLRGERIDISPARVADIIHEPVGVVALITPFNGAFSLGTWKLAPALAAGNSIIIKPPLSSPASTLLLKRVVDDAGVPPGVVSVLQGGREVGERLVNDHRVNMVSFTGSTPAATAIGTSVVARLGRFVAEAGGKSAHIVFDDADVQEAVTAVVQGGFSATGQTCVAGSRVLVHEGIADQFVKELVSRVERLRVGDPSEPQTHLGPIASAEQRDRIVSLISQAISDGAEVLAGGLNPPELDESLENGFWLRPTVLKVKSNSLNICQTEVFGPVVTLMQFSEEDEAVAIANDTQFGLAAGCWTSDAPRGRRMVSRLNAGTVWLNAYRGMDWQTPFGGFKQSGLGKENGIEGLREFQQVKSVVEGLEPAPDPFGLI